MKQQVLTLDQVRAYAPSVFANNPFPGVSNRYAFVPTAQVVEGLMTEGWMPTAASQSFVRTDERRGYQKHLLRFARVEDIDRVNSLITRGNHTIQRNDPLTRFVEVVLSNSHDGMAAYQIHGGIFELVCMNGLIIAGATFGAIHVRHTGDPREIIGASYQILDNTAKFMGVVDEWQKIMLNWKQQEAFALGAAALRYDFDKEENCPINYKGLLATRRAADQTGDLWTTFNVVQENVMKGGQSIRLGETHVTEAGRIIRPTKTRKVNSVNANLKVNQGLWVMAQKLAEQTQ